MRARGQKTGEGAASAVRHRTKPGQPPQPANWQGVSPWHQAAGEICGLVLRHDPLAGRGWSNEEVARRWVEAFPPTERGEVVEALKPERRELILDDPGRVARARCTLGSMSHFMKHLEQPIARRANLEDDRTGHFFEQRFYSGAMLTEEALIAAMAYVDLNPPRPPRRCRRARRSPSTWRSGRCGSTPRRPGDAGGAQPARPGSGNARRPEDARRPGGGGRHPGARRTAAPRPPPRPSRNYSRRRSRCATTAAWTPPCARRGCRR